MNDSEYINKDVFVAQQRNQHCINCERRKGTKNGKRIFVYEIGETPCRACDIEDMIDAVWDFFPADVAPVVHGHWETPEKQFPFWDWKCSVCGCEEYRQRDSHGNYRMMNFCPNCGAKMGESEENINEN